MACNITEQSQVVLRQASELKGAETPTQTLLRLFGPTTSGEFRRPPIIDWLGIYYRADVADVPPYLVTQQFYDEVPDHLISSKNPTFKLEEARVDQKIKKYDFLSQIRRVTKCKKDWRSRKEATERNCACVPHTDFLQYVPPNYQHRVRNFWKVECRQLTKKSVEYERIYPFDTQTPSGTRKEFQESIVRLAVTVEADFDAAEKTTERS